MGDYKEKHGTTRIGDILRGLGDVGKPILEAAGGLTGQLWLSKLADGIKTSRDIDDEQKQRMLSALQLDLADRSNARSMTMRVQETDNASWLAKNISPILALLLFCLAAFIVVALVLTKVPYENRELLYLVLGLVLGFFGSAVTFYFGSSDGSKDKTKELISSMKK